MKLNFLHVMNKKSGPDEIAEQIVALEIKKGQCEKFRDEAKQFCKEMRGKIMCGEQVDSDAVKQADRAYDEAGMDLEIVTESIEELKKKLMVALETYRQDEQKRLVDARRKLEQEREKVMREFAKAKGRLLGLACGIYGRPENAISLLEGSRSFTFTNADQFHEEFEAERVKAVAELKRPTFADVDEQCRQKDFWLGGFNSDEEYARILKKYRDQQGVEVQEAQPVEV